MKILHVSTFDGGGAAKAAIRLHLSLIKSNCDSSILFLYKQNNSIPKSYKYENKQNLNIGSLKRYFFRIRNKLKPIEILKSEINKKLLENKVSGFEIFSFNSSDFDITTQKIYQEADIIHLHWTAGFLDFDFFTKNTKPIVWTLHDMNPFTGGCHYSLGCDKFKIDCSKCPQLEGTIDNNNSNSNLFYKLNTLKKSKVVITAPSRWLKKCSEESVLFSSFKHELIPYSLDFETFNLKNKSFSKSVFNLPNDKKVLLFVSDTVENIRKGFDLLLNSLKGFNVDDYHLCCVGSSNKMKLNTLNITYTGKINDERLMALLFSSADAFILPSIEDNLPNVMLESLACGTPVVCFAKGGMLDVIKTGLNGIIIEDFNEESLRMAILDVINERYKFDSIQIANDASKMFSEKRQAKSYIEQYRNLIIDK